VRIIHSTWFNYIWKAVFACCCALCLSSETLLHSSCLANSRSTQLSGEQRRSTRHPSAILRPMTEPASRPPQGQIVLITGNMASGKSSVAQALAERLPRSVHLRGDLFRRMIINGRAEMGLELSTEVVSSLLRLKPLTGFYARRHLDWATGSTTRTSRSTRRSHTSWRRCQGALLTLLPLATAERLARASVEPLSRNRPLLRRRKPDAKQCADGRRLP
jgi:hypothetical protein